MEKKLFFVKKYSSKKGDKIYEETCAVFEDIDKARGEALRLAERYAKNFEHHWDRYSDEYTTTCLQGMTAENIACVKEYSESNGEDYILLLFEVVEQMVVVHSNCPLILYCIEYYDHKVAECPKEGHIWGEAFGNKEQARSYMKLVTSMYASDNDGEIRRSLSCDSCTVRVSARLIRNWHIIELVTE